MRTGDLGDIPIADMSKDRTDSFRFRRLDWYLLQQEGFPIEFVCTKNRVGIKNNSIYFVLTLCSEK